MIGDRAKWCCIGACLGVLAAWLLFLPLLEGQRRALVGAWDESVAAWERHAKSAYERGRADGIEFAGLARECAR